jgi:hypothetical protein
MIILKMKSRAIASFHINVQITNLVYFLVNKISLLYFDIFALLRMPTIITS